MNDRSGRDPLALSIGAVERDTGLSKDTLRVWERRYGFPTPLRDAFGERLYPADQVERLRVVRRLMDAGHRPGRLLRLSAEDLQALAGSVAPKPQSAAEADHCEDLRRLLDLVRTRDVEALRDALSQTLVRSGLERFVLEVAAPMTHLVGEEWARGALEIFEEHLYTECLQGVLLNAMSNVRLDPGWPRVLLTTLPQEPHGLGLLMAESALLLEGCRCVSLGVQTPLRDIANAARAQRADIVALSFSTLLNAKQVAEDLVQLRAELPADIEVWAGGQSPVLQRRPPAGVRVVTRLAEIREAVQAWRAGQRAGTGD